MVESLFRTMATLEWGLKPEPRYTQYVLGSLRITFMFLLAYLIILQSRFRSDED